MRILSDNLVNGQFNISLKRKRYYLKKGNLAKIYFTRNPLNNLLFFENAL